MPYLNKHQRYGLLLTASVLLFATGANRAYGQKKTYLNSAMEPVKKKYATYYQVKERKGDHIEVNVFGQHSDRLVEKYRVRTQGDEVKHGPYETYFKDGSIQTKGQFQDGKKTGTWIDYTKQGNLRSRYTERNDTVYYLQYWNDAGDSCLHNGTGVAQVHAYERNETIEFRDSIMYARYYIRAETGDTVYTSCAQLTEPVGGVKNLFANTKTVYPQLAKDAGIQGTVYLEVIVNATGSITDIHILRGIGGGCDQAAIDAITNSSVGWIPGEHEGRKVTSSIMLPMRFILL